MTFRDGVVVIERLRLFAVCHNLHDTTSKSDYLGTCLYHSLFPVRPRIVSNDYGEEEDSD